MIQATQQTHEVERFLATCCEVCGVPHDPDIHEAVLRLRGPAPVFVFGPDRSFPRDQFQSLTPTVMRCRCGLVFESMNPRITKRCPSCAAAKQASAVRTTRASRRRRAPIVTD